MADAMQAVDRGSAPCGVVIVAHNNAATVGPTVESVLAQKRDVDRMVLVDCGSADASWLKQFEGAPGVRVIAVANLGYAGGNNVGWHELALSEDSFVLFLNPDVILPSGLLDRLRGLMVEPRSQRCAMISPRLHGYDFAARSATGQIDSTGVFPTKWGAWRDRRENSPPEGDILEKVPALCGAFLWARASALRSVELRDGEVFDSRYLAYKEDIELSLRLGRAGWNVAIWHDAVAWHGRGWKDRRRMPRASRLLSARNEIRLHAAYAPARLPYSMLKWLYVRWLER